MEADHFNVFMVIEAGKEETQNRLGVTGVRELVTLQDAGMIVCFSDIL